MQLCVVVSTSRFNEPGARFDIITVEDGENLEVGQFCLEPTPGTLLWSYPDGGSVPATAIGSSQSSHSRSRAKSAASRREALLSDEASDWQEGEDPEKLADVIVREKMDVSSHRFVHNAGANPDQLGVGWVGALRDSLCSEPCVAGLMLCCWHAWQLFWRRVGRLIRWGFRGWFSMEVLLFCLLVGLTAANSYVTVLAGVINGPLTQAVVSQDHSMLFNAIIRGVVLVGLSTFFTSCISFIAAALGVMWYRSVVTRFHERYFKGRLLYAANNIVPGLDNVDQRIVMDTRTFITEFFGVLYTFLSGLFTLGVGLRKAIPYGWMPICIICGYDVHACATPACLAVPIMCLDRGCNHRVPGTPWSCSLSRTAC